MREYYPAQTRQVLVIDLLRCYGSWPNHRYKSRTILLARPYIFLVRILLLGCLQYTTRQGNNILSLGSSLRHHLLTWLLEAESQGCEKHVSSHLPYGRTRVTDSEAKSAKCAATRGHRQSRPRTPSAPGMLEPIMPHHEELGSWRQDRVTSLNHIW